MERGFNAGQTHRSIYPFIFNRLRAIQRYWSEIATFSYLLAFNAPVGSAPKFYERINDDDDDDDEKFGPQKTRIMGLPGSEDSLTIG